MCRIVLMLGCWFLAGCLAHTQPPAGIPVGLDVRSFGARGDGRTDDTAAIQKAIDTAAANHDTVFFPAGTYLCATVRLRPQVGLFAHPTPTYWDHGGAILKLNDPKAKCLLDLSDAKGVTLDGLCLDGNNKLGQNIHGILVDKAVYGKEDAWRIERCRVTHFSGHGLDLERIFCFTVRHCSIAFNGGNGIRIRGWDGFILDNWISSNGDAGIGAYDENAAVTITANRIEWNAHAGIEIRAGNWYNITGNFIDRSGGPAVKLVGGKIWGRTEATPCSGITVTGNVIYRSGAPLHKIAPEPVDNCHLRFDQVLGLTCVGNTLISGRDDGAKGIWSPEVGIRCRRLQSAVIRDNVLHEGALRALVENQGEHVGEVILRDNPGTLRVPPPTTAPAVPAP